LVECASDRSTGWHARIQALEPTRANTRKKPDIVSNKQNPKCKMLVCWKYEAGHEVIRVEKELGWRCFPFTFRLTLLTQTLHLFNTSYLFSSYPASFRVLFLPLSIPFAPSIFKSCIDIEATRLKIRVGKREARSVDNYLQVDASFHFPSPSIPKFNH
jgi:hypothetical protein